MSKRPKREDFLDRPVSNDERIEALNRLVEREVMDERSRKYNEAKEKWDYSHFVNGNR
jgi:FixJ family two-component response regulator